MTKSICAIFALLALPGVLWASEGQATAAVVDFTASVYGYLGVLLFVLAYSLVPLENKIQLRNSKPVILAAGIIWILVAIGSAAGVALMGTARGTYTFGGHLKWTPVIALGYVAGIMCHMIINARFF